MTGSPETPKQQLRKLLSELERESQTSYDKAVLTLSGGALGITISFVKNVIKGKPLASEFLFTSWVCWGISLACVLYSFYSSALALRKAVVQLDANTIRAQKPGGLFDKATEVLNFGSGGLFLAGTFLFVLFAFKNLER